MQQIKLSLSRNVCRCFFYKIIHTDINPSAAATVNNLLESSPKNEKI
uniref:Uncharacterized protein n=1 Tax=Anguilla anguilla TaxID=7936 RepID=A0A0E9TRS3_ANGAN